MSVLGFYEETAAAIVNGIVLSIVRAHDNLQPGSISWNTDVLLETNINRSLMAYLNNPSEERAQYDYDVDKNMTLLKFVSDSGKPLGLINW